MRQLIFKELLLLSGFQKSARRVTFGRSKTLITGPNEAGKSAILKSIYSSFGIDIPARTTRWENAEVISALKFELGGREYQLLRNGDNCTFFNKDHVVLGSFEVSEPGLSTYIASLFDFRLQFFTKSDDAQDAHQRYLFAPYYVDQDKGWTGPWGSFRELNQERRLDTIEYHTGLRPNEYFVLKARLKKLQAERVNPANKREGLKSFAQEMHLKQLEKSAPLVLNSQQFKAEIEMMVAKCVDLKNRHEIVQKRIVEIADTLVNLRTEAALAERAKEELSKDFKFAARALGDSVSCPLCGNHYTNGILEQFQIAQDEDICTSLIVNLRSQEKPLVEELQTLRNQQNQDAQELNELNEILDTHRNEVTLREVINTEGRRELMSELNLQIESLEKDIQAIDSQIFDARSEMKKLRDPERRSDIYASYQSKMRDTAVDLDVSPLPKEMLSSVAPIIELGSSDFPRKLLTYYVGVLKTIVANGSGVYCPFVIDAVNQQDQSGANLPRMYDLLFNKLPPNTQLIVGGVSTAGIKFDGTVVELPEKQSALLESEYESVSSEVHVLLDAQFKYMTSRRKEADNNNNSSSPSSPN